MRVCFDFWYTGWCCGTHTMWEVQFCIETKCGQGTALILFIWLVKKVSLVTHNNFHIVFVFIFGEKKVCQLINHSIQLLWIAAARIERLLAGEEGSVQIFGYWTVRGLLLLLMTLLGPSHWYKTGMVYGVCPQPAFCSARSEACSPIAMQSYSFAAILGHCLVLVKTLMMGQARKMYCYFKLNHSKETVLEFKEVRFHNINKYNQQPVCMWTGFLLLNE